MLNEMDQLIARLGGAIMALSMELQREQAENAVFKKTNEALNAKLSEAQEQLMDADAKFVALEQKSAQEKERVVIGVQYPEAIPGGMNDYLSH